MDGSFDFENVYFISECQGLSLCVSKTIRVLSQRHRKKNQKRKVGKNLGLSPRSTCRDSK